MKKYIVLAAFLSLGTMSLQAAKLVGIYNNLTQEGKRAAPTVQIIQRNAQGNISNVIPVAEATPGIIKDVDVNLPVAVQIAYTLDGKLTNYVLKIEEAVGQCESGTTPVKAYVEGGTTEEKRLCVSNAYNTLPGSQRFLWSNVGLVLYNSDTYVPGRPDSLPFKFEIMKLTTAKGIWQSPKIGTSADKTVTFDRPLRVVPGLSALGGGMVPRPQLGQIAHIYNDSRFLLQVSRVGDGWDFLKFVPPYSAIPFSMIWIPKITAEQKAQGSKYGVYLSLLDSEKIREELKQDQSPEFAIRGQAGTNVLPEVQSTGAQIQKALDEDQKSPTKISELFGLSNYRKLMSDQWSDYKRGLYSYKIYSAPDKQGVLRIYIDRCSQEKGVTECKEYFVSKDPAINAFKDPNYFNLLVKQEKITV